jgi:small-conductance mechanosensitive channel
MAPDVVIPASSFVNRYDDELTALGSVAVAVLAAILLDRVFARRGRAMAAAVGRGELSPVAQTRLRFVRRLVSTVIVLLGVMIAIAQFGTLSKVATSVLASGALAAAVVGFAARQVLANSVAGVMLAITQPLRIGDHVAFEGDSGTVEDVRLNYTYLRTGAGTRVVIPNERLAAGVLHNDSMASPSGRVRVPLWLPLEDDADAAVAALQGLAGVSAVEVAEVSADGVRLELTAEAGAAERRGGREAELRAAALRALRRAGLLRGPSAGEARA